MSILMHSSSRSTSSWTFATSLLFDANRKGTYKKNLGPPWQKSTTNGIKAQSYVMEKPSKRSFA